ncbi:MAG: CapA family protein [Alphaproteobacteria bacterium]|nr:CapA family protein [Alphaproteobacteria bacterium]MCB9697756.1 CapA family protein [Alphaproteobacteria bacterium]
MPLLLAIACTTHPVAPGPLDPTGPPPAAAAIEPVARELASVTVAAVGDTMMHGMVKRSAADANVVVDGKSTNHGGYDALFDDVRAQLSAADIAFTNLETPIAPKNHKGTEEKVFDAPVDLLDALVDAGFDVVSVANNHAYDQGRAGLAETLEHVGERPLVPIGAGSTCAEAAAPRLVKRGELTLAFIGSTDIYNADLNKGPDETCVFTLDIDQVKASVDLAREQGADLVLLSVHWGVEYRTEPEKVHVEKAHAAIEAGVDVILGHHPHVLQPIEVVEASDGRTGVIVYSMGNFISNQSYWYQPGLHGSVDGNPRDGLIVTFRAVRKAYGRGARQVVRTEVADLVATPLWTTNNIMRRPSSVPVLIRVTPTAERIRALEASLGTAAEPRQIVTLSKDLAEMQVRWAMVGNIVGPQWLPPRPAPGDEG